MEINCNPAAAAAAAAAATAESLKIGGNTQILPGTSCGLSSAKESRQKEVATIYVSLEHGDS